MIADLVDDTFKIRLITRNVMCVYSTDKQFVDSFLLKLKHSNYIVNNEQTKSDSIVAYTKKSYNPYENIYRYILRNNNIDATKFSEYLNYFGLNHLLWVHFYQLNKNDLLLVETLMSLSNNKQVVILDEIDSLECKNNLYSLAFHLGLENRLIIIPFTNIHDAVNNSTCQCYVKNYNAAKIQSDFSNEFINTEFNTSEEYYSRIRPSIYKKSDNYIMPSSYKYTLYELFLIYLYYIKMIISSLNVWRYQLPCL